MKSFSKTAMLKLLIAGHLSFLPGLSFDNALKEVIILSVFVKQVPNQMVA
jgi:hypothetical protein